MCEGRMTPGEVILHGTAPAGKLAPLRPFRALLSQTGTQPRFRHRIAFLGGQACKEAVVSPVWSHFLLQWRPGCLE